jgi:hypothetical protein
MIANRIFSFSVIFIFSSFSFLQSSDFSSTNTDLSQEWVSLYAQQMNPEELQITANFLYILYANALIDTEIQKYYVPLARLSQIARNNLSDISNPNHELNQLGALTEKLSLLIKTRLLYTELLGACFNQINQNKIDIVNNALKTLQTHASDMLYEWANKNNKEFAHDLEKTAKVLADCEQSIHFASDLHKGLSNGILPYVVEEKDKPLAIVNVILQTSPTFMHTADTATNALNTISNRAMETICFGAEIYKDYYKTLYTLLMENFSDTEYTTTLFDKYGLSKEYNSLLPDTDHILEHLLETTKLAIQLKSTNNILE